MLTKELIEKALPSNLKSAVTTELVDLVNNASSDQLIAEEIRNNFLSYSNVLKNGKFKTEEYLNAIKFVSYKLMGDSNQDAYFKTFPNRYQSLLAKGTSPKDISAYVAAYAKGKLVNLILEQSLVPSWVLNQDVYQKAINTQLDLMNNSKSDKVRCDAANSILTHLAKPKEAGPLINIDMRENNGVKEMKEALAQMAEQQRALIMSGVSTSTIASQELIKKEVFENGTY